jgi:hypothetical protein
MARVFVAPEAKYRHKANVARLASAQRCGGASAFT